MFFSDKNISRIDASARNVRNIVYFYTCMFNDRIFDILYITLLCNFFCNISSFLCLISWSFSIKSIYSRLLRRVLMWSLIHIFSSRYFLRVISHFLFIISNAWFRRSSSLSSFFRSWCLETCSWLVFRVLSFQISRVVRSSSRRRLWFKNRWISIFFCFLRRLFWRSLIF